jgi:hypothetical protein
MAAVTFKCVITCELTPFLALQDLDVTLKQSGTTWTGTQAVEVAATLKIAYTVNGTDNSNFTVTITPVCSAGTPQKVFDDQGTIPGGSKGVTKTVPLPVPLCK